MTKSDFIKDIEHAAEVITTFRGKVNFGIPDSIVDAAKGIAVLHVTKLGLIASERKLLPVWRMDRGPLQLPFIPLASVLVINDLIFVLNTDAAVRSFWHGHNFSLGGEVSVAVGPLGREADAELTSSLAAIYTYSHSKVYGVGTTGKQILSGEVPKPEFAQVLYDALAQGTDEE
ncbi:DUF500-domain-containing protein [Rhizoclosmatium globosum]|uniref:DUF500-domain-containing protein n=1 Tax=Rhizoclosmatium globosum TaxID=329046 RepID=A0A1Y2CAD3_9FUNG|nr:DUF500-domain-containing protein [Rhizoclosmatium globosum]|eukprot:ORY43992.1 DUF500-domain-containing protein [Rhizoclosmatium globosum]